VIRTPRPTPRPTRPPTRRCGPENALYVLYANGDQEYYDTATDPLELDNIASKGVPPELVKALVALENCHNGVACWAAAHLH
jgi:N-acetylglucosamine-6-sulfatase